MLGTQGADDLGLSFGCLELQYCVNGGGVDPNDDVTDDNKVPVAKPNVKSLPASECALHRAPPPPSLPASFAVKTRPTPSHFVGMRRSMALKTCMTLRGTIMCDNEHTLPLPRDAL